MEFDCEKNIVTDWLELLTHDTLQIVRLVLKGTIRISGSLFNNFASTFVGKNDFFLLFCLPTASLLRSSDITAKRNSFLQTNILEKLGESAILCFEIDHSNINITFFSQDSWILINFTVYWSHLSVHIIIFLEVISLNYMSTLKIATGLN